MRLPERLLTRLRTSQPVAWLIVGLGNPGPRYRGTRHNIGRRALEELAARWDAQLDETRFNARFGTIRRDGQRLCLAVPITFMNEAGRAVAPVARFYRVPPERLLVIHDDLDLPLGALRLRAGGGSGGHRGMASVITALGTRDFPRLRLGIGRPPPKWDPADYVLAPFRTEERAIAAHSMALAADVVETTVREGIARAMNVCNR